MMTPRISLPANAYAKSAVQGYQKRHLSDCLGVLFIHPLSVFHHDDPADASCGILGHGKGSVEILLKFYPIRQEMKSILDIQ